jgi:hypothetical protein
MHETMLQPAFTVNRVPKQVPLGTYLGSRALNSEGIDRRNETMHLLARLPLYALIAGVFFTSGCVVAPDHEHYRGYDRRDSAEYREHQRREAYRHCREAGERDCDDLLHH